MNNKPFKPNKLYEDIESFFNFSVRRFRVYE